ncbi:hypothetical protein AgCh_034402 [Apium graveolens]
MTQYRRLARRMDAMHDIHSRFTRDLTQALGTAFRATSVDIQWPVFGEDSVYPPPDTPYTPPIEGWCPWNKAREDQLIAARKEENGIFSRRPARPRCHSARPRPKEFDVVLFAYELIYFYQLKPTRKDSGSFYLAGWGVYEVKSFTLIVPIETPVMSPLKGKLLRRAKRALKLSSKLGDEMASGIPVGIKQTFNHEDICSDEEDAGPIAASLITKLKHGERITEATRVDQKLADKVQQLKTTLKSRDDDRKIATETLRKIRAFESKLLKENGQLNQAIVTLEKEKEEEVAELARKNHELELKVSRLQSVVDNNKAVLLDANKAKYKAGWAKGVKDFIKSTIDVFHDLDWSRLGEDAVKEAAKIQHYCL